LIFKEHAGRIVKLECEGCTCKYLTFKSVRKQILRDFVEKWSYSNVLMKPESLVSYTTVNSFPDLVHTIRHTMEASHARSHYLNCKEGMSKARLVTGVKS